MKNSSLNCCEQQQFSDEFTNTRKANQLLAGWPFLYLKARLPFVYEIRLTLRAVELKVDRCGCSL